MKKTLIAVALSAALFSGCEISDGGMGNMPELRSITCSAGEMTYSFEDGSRAIRINDDGSIYDCSE